MKIFSLALLLISPFVNVVGSTSNSSNLPFENAWQCPDAERNSWVKIARCDFSRNKGNPKFRIEEAGLSLYRY